MKNQVVWLGHCYTGEVLEYCLIIRGASLTVVLKFSGGAGSEHEDCKGSFKESKKASRFVMNDLRNTTENLREYSFSFSFI